MDEKTENNKSLFPSEEELKNKQESSDLDLKSSEKTEQEVTSQEKGSSDSQAEAKSEPTKKQEKLSAEDFFVHNKPENKISSHDLKLKQEANSSEWLHLTEQESTPIKKYHDFPSYFYAGFWMRMWAYLVDIICIGSITGIVMKVMGNILTISGIGYGIITSLCYLAYFILMTKLMKGQTIGKMIFGLKVISFTEDELSWSTVIVREGACRFILQIGFLMVGYIVAAFTPYKQHIGDLFSDTSVVTLNTLKAYNGLTK